MGDALAELEAAIIEVTKARKLVMQKTAKQVSAGDEIDRLKSVAFAWFKTHRPSVASHSSGPELGDVDTAYQTVLTATGKIAARTTYTNALLAAKRSLVVVRGSVATVQDSTPAVATTDAQPNFAPLANDPKMQMILIRRWDEIQSCIDARAHLSATVMMGGMLESLLLARINGSPNRTAVFTANGAPRDRVGATLPLADWKLVKMVEVGHELGWITKSARDVGNVLREFRNYIHPHKEYTDGVLISADDTRMFWEVTKAISRQVLGSVGKSP